MESGSNSARLARLMLIDRPASSTCYIIIVIVDDSRNSPIAVVFHLQKSPPVTLGTLDHDRRQSVQVIVFSVNRL